MPLPRGIQFHMQTEGIHSIPITNYGESIFIYRIRERESFQFLLITENLFYSHLEQAVEFPFNVSFDINVGLAFPKDNAWVKLQKEKVNSYSFMMLYLLLGSVMPNLEVFTVEHTLALTSNKI